MVDRTGQPVEVRSSSDQFSCDIRNVKSAQSQFPLATQPEMTCQTGGSVQARIAEERENAHAQIRTMLDEQRRTIIDECNEKVLHHELLAAHAEQDRKVLQEELLRQQQEFREVHQQDLMKHLELQKFQNSAFDAAEVAATQRGLDQGLVRAGRVSTDLWSAARPWSRGSSVSAGLPTSMTIHFAHFQKEDMRTPGTGGGCARVRVCVVRRHH